jgi:uncharacterized protein YdeI (YjbR/CyaY-like superfamily)
MTTVSFPEALEAAICWGWIDNQRLPLDGTFYLQRFSRRRPKSGWSKINTGKAEALIAAGRMQPPGMREVEAAKADGRWAAAYQGQKGASPPEDFMAELEKNPEAKAFYDTLNSVNRYSIYYRLQSAKRPETRRARIEKFVQMLAEGRRFYE